jgi:hypothetical protein
MYGYDFGWRSYYRWMLYGGPRPRRNAFFAPLKRMGSIKIMPPKPASPPKCVCPKDKRQSVALPKASLSPPTIAESDTAAKRAVWAKIVTGEAQVKQLIADANVPIIQLADVAMLTAPQLMSIFGLTDAAAENVRDNNALHDALGIHWSASSVPHPAPPSGPRWEHLVGPNLRDWYRQFRRPKPTPSYTYSMEKIVNMELKRQWDGDDGDRTIINGTLRSATSTQRRGVSWIDYEARYKPWTNYHYKHQVVIRAPLAGSIRERDAIVVNNTLLSKTYYLTTAFPLFLWFVLQARCHPSFDAAIPMVHRRVMRVSLLAWIYHIYDAIRQLCIQMCPEFQKKKAVKKMWVMGPG